MSRMPQWTGDTQLSSNGVAAGASSTGVAAGARGHLADELAEKDSDTQFTGPEPVRGLPYSVFKRAIRDWVERKHI